MNLLVWESEDTYWVSSDLRPTLLCTTSAGGWLLRDLGNEGLLSECVPSASWGCAAKRRARVRARVRVRVRVRGRGRGR